MIQLKNEGLRTSRVSDATPKPRHRNEAMSAALSPDVRTSLASNGLMSIDAVTPKESLVWAGP